MRGTRSQVACERGASRLAQRDDVAQAALADHEHGVVIEVDVVDGQARGLTASESAVDQQADERHVAPLGEVLALTRLEQPLERLVVDEGHRLLGDGGRSHLRHRARRSRPPPRSR